MARLEEATTLVFTERDYLDACSNIYGVLKNYLKPVDKVVDLGCALGWFGRKFLEMGSEVVFIDGRAENLAVINKELPNSETILLDVEGDFPDIKADLVICAGLIYHTGTPRLLLEKIAKMADNIIIETRSLDHDGVMVVYFGENTVPYHSSFTGGSCAPSPGWFDKNLKEVGFSVVRDISHGDANVNYPDLCTSYDWKIQRTCGWRRDERSLRKLYIASKSLETSVFQL